MAKPREKPALVINAPVWLMDEDRFTILKNLGHTPRRQEILETEGERRARAGRSLS